MDKKLKERFAMLIEIYEAERRRISELDMEETADIEHPVFGEGNAESPLIMFIGEAPGREEAACGRPFVGKAGKQLDRMLVTAGIDRGSVFVTNTVKYRPITKHENSVCNRTPSVKEIKAGLETLYAELMTVRPRIIATLGNVPLKAVQLLSQDDKLTVGEVHGMPRMAFVRGVPMELFPLYHPAASIYYRELKPVLERDLIALGAFARQAEGQ